MKTDISRFAPPGADLNPQAQFFAVGLVGAMLYSFGFLFRLMDAISNLYGFDGVKRVLVPDAVMPQFVNLLDKSFVGFVILATSMLGFIFYNYAYHKQGSKSIYLMRRLPNRFELHRRCFTLPVVAATMCMLIAALLFAIYYGLYVFLTPKECLAPQKWQGIWRVLL